MNRTQRLKALIGKGYFPKELPPPFSTEILAKKTLLVGKKWDAVGAAAQAAKPKRQHPLVSKPVEFSMARRGHLRRTLSLPNPVAHYYLCDCLAMYADKLDVHIAQSPYSITRATIQANDARAVPMVAFAELAERRVRMYAPYKFILQTDLTNFYRAIYTHSIPWALHGKTAAKSSRGQNSSMYGNIIDFLVRQAQDGQTMGLPVGPDTSRIISEVVLSAIDVRVAATAPSSAGLRYVDDYFLCFDDEQLASVALTALNVAVAAFELTINSNKTKLISVDRFNEDTWTAAVNSISFSDDTETQGRDIVSFFSRVIEISQNNPSESIASYAIRLTSSVTIRRDNWETYLAFLLRLCRENSNTFDAISKLICTYAALGYPVGPTLPAFLDKFIQDQTRVGHHFEVAWALWLAASLKLPLSEECASALDGLDNSVCALLGLHLQHQGLTPRPLDFSSWLPVFGPDALHGEHWLLMYEAAVHGWFEPAAKAAITLDPYFSELHTNDVRFFDEKATNRPLELPHVEHRLRLVAAGAKSRVLPGNVYVPPNRKGGSTVGFAERLGSHYGRDDAIVFFDELEDLAE